MYLAALVVKLPAGSFASHARHVKNDDFGPSFAEIGIDLMPESLDIIGYRLEDNC